MKTTDLLKAKPSLRSEMIVDAYAHLASRAQQIVLEVKILNNWLSLQTKGLAVDGATFPDIDKLKANIEAWESQTDQLTEGLIENSEQMKRFLEASIYYQKYGDNKTIVE